MNERLLRHVFLSLLMAIAMMAAACGADEGTQADPVNDDSEEAEAVEENEAADGAEDNQEENDESVQEYEPEEATVTLTIHWGDSEFENFFRTHVEEALPHITLEYLQSRSREDMEEHLAQGNVPDLIMTSDFEYYDSIDMLRDMQPLIDKHGFDLSRLDSNIVDTLANHSRPGELNALPLFRPDYMMAYNKDIFDAFGMNYPEDGMTWEEAVDLANSLTGEIDGVHYHGLWPDKDQLSQVGITFLDPETDEVIIEGNEDLQVFLQRQQQIFNIPGNLPPEDAIEEELAQYLYSGPGNADLAFDYALVPGRSHTSGHLQREIDGGLNFDWVTYPTWGGDYPDYNPNNMYHNIIVTNHAENPDAAFEVVQYLLSEEYQEWWVSANYGVTPLTSEDVISKFGQEVEEAELLAAKNWQAQFELPGAPIPVQSQYEGSVQEPALVRGYELLLEGQDVGTAMREMQEVAEQVVSDLQGAN